MPTTWAKAYEDAGYFARTVRTVEVFVDRAAVRTVEVFVDRAGVASGAAVAGDPWQLYDLGHGCCTYTFSE